MDDAAMALPGAPHLHMGGADYYARHQHECVGKNYITMGTEASQTLAHKDGAARTGPLSPYEFVKTGLGLEPTIVAAPTNCVALHARRGLSARAELDSLKRERGGMARCTERVTIGDLFEFVVQQNANLVAFPLGAAIKVGPRPPERCPR